ncbi:MAG: hypothetical protein IPK46_08625 [Saprospiraceae bacterium]|nr:hypothetical protein [Saprospiraceae bacterium]
MIKYIQIIAVFLLLLPVTSQGQTRKNFWKQQKLPIVPVTFMLPWSITMRYWRLMKNVDIILNLLKPRENLIPMLLQQKNMRC